MAKSDSRDQTWNKERSLKSLRLALASLLALLSCLGPAQYSELPLLKVPTQSFKLTYAFTADDVNGGDMITQSNRVFSYEAAVDSGLSKRLRKQAGLEGKQAPPSGHFSGTLVLEQSAKVSRLMILNDKGEPLYSRWEYPDQVVLQMHKGKAFNPKPRAQAFPLPFPIEFGFSLPTYRSSFLRQDITETDAKLNGESAAYWRPMSNQPVYLAIYGRQPKPGSLELAMIDPAVPGLMMELNGPQTLGGVTVWKQIDTKVYEVKNEGTLDSRLKLKTKMVLQKAEPLSSPIPEWRSLVTKEDKVDGEEKPKPATAIPTLDAPEAATTKGVAGDKLREATITFGVFIVVAAGGFYLMRRYLKN